MSLIKYKRIFVRDENDASPWGLVDKLTLLLFKLRPDNRFLLSLIRNIHDSYKRLSPAVSESQVHGE